MPPPGRAELDRSLLVPAQPTATTTLAPGRPVEREGSASPVRVLGCFRGIVTLGGLERMMIAAGEALVESGASVHFVFSKLTETAVLDASRRAGVTCSITPDRGRLRRGLSAWPGNLWEAMRSSTLLLRETSRFGPTHLLIPEFGVIFDQWLALVLLRLRGRRVILALQNAPLETPRFRRLWAWLIDPVVDTYVCASAACQRPLLSFGVAPGKLRLVYNAPPARMPARADPVQPVPDRVIYVGQIIPAKGLDLLLEAVGILAARGASVSLDIVGRHDGWIAPEYEAFRRSLFERVTRPDLAGRVRFLGFREDVPALMAAAAVHCIPSRPEMCEGFGIVVAEAKEAGIPSVAFRHGPFPELIEHGRTGWLCEALTPAALAEGLEFFLRPSARAGAMRAEIRASASRFSRESFARGWRRVFALDGAD